MASTPRNLLAKELKISSQAISQRRIKIQTKYGPMTDMEAYGVIGHLANLDVAKLFSLESKELAQIRNICIQIQNNGQEPKHEKKPTKKQKEKTVRVIRIGGNVDYSDPLLPNKVLQDAKKMTDVYTTLYVFENSVREVISLVMTKKFGKEWWNKLTAEKATKMRQDVKGRLKQESKNAWHGKRGSHPIHYTDISDLINIFDEYWSDFSPFFPDKGWVQRRIKEISMSRNIVDHHNPLNENDQKRVQVYFTDWSNQIATLKEDLNL